MMPALANGWWLCGAAFVLSVALTWAAIAYAHQRGMLDEPGYRRSHSIPTPRGGGVGLVVGTLLVVMVALPYWPGGHVLPVAVAMGVAGLLVAVAGWVDDHRDIPVLSRLLVQLLAAGLFSATVIHAHHLAWMWLLPCVLLAAWSINLHNFMDGIDGILGLQILFVGAGLGVLALEVAQVALAITAFGLAAAAAGFLLFNWPPARIFMGDVGSGFAGFAIFALVLLLAVRVLPALWPALILCSAFVTDAGLTLAWRIWRGKRWYTAHREHLYQWLVRCDCTHAMASGLYMLWNLLVAAPVAVWAASRPVLAPWLCLMMYVVASGTWWQARRACLEKARRKGGRQVA
ncbi:MAG TPA: glycosyl transferase family 4 [Rhodanobacteraceae bacterium]|nr:glycosyl transferase family 4 [Rhodanobacteraceae bacterium]